MSVFTLHCNEDMQDAASLLCSPTRKRPYSGGNIPEPRKGSREVVEKATRKKKMTPTCEAPPNGDWGSDKNIAPGFPIDTMDKPILLPTEAAQMLRLQDEAARQIFQRIGKWENRGMVTKQPHDSPGSSHRTAWSLSNPLHGGNLCGGGGYYFCRVHRGPNNPYAQAQEDVSLHLFRTAKGWIASVDCLRDVVAGLSVKQQDKNNCNRFPPVNRMLKFDKAMLHTQFLEESVELLDGRVSRCIEDPCSRFEATYIPSRLLVGQEQHPECDDCWFPRLTNKADLFLCRNSVEEEKAQ